MLPLDYCKPPPLLTSFPLLLQNKKSKTPKGVFGILLFSSNVFPFVQHQVQKKTPLDGGSNIFRE